MVRLLTYTVVGVAAGVAVALGGMYVALLYGPDNIVSI
jgi:hypothetical protein